MANIEQKVENLLKPKIEEIGYELYDVEYVKEGKNYFLRIYIDNEKGKKEQAEKVAEELKHIQENHLVVLEGQKKRRNNPYKVKITKEIPIKGLIIIMIISIFTGLLTPLGTTPYTYLIKTMKGNTTHNISEHLPLTLVNNIPIMTLLIMFIIILMFTDTKIKLRDLFIAFPSTNFLTSCFIGFSLLSY